MRMSAATVPLGHTTFSTKKLSFILLIFPKKGNEVLDMHD